jgi:hypothetical protein
LDDGLRAISPIRNALWVHWHERYRVRPGEANLPQKQHHLQDADLELATDATT